MRTKSFLLLLVGGCVICLLNSPVYAQDEEPTPTPPPEEPTPPPEEEPSPPPQDAEPTPPPIDPIPTPTPWPISELPRHVENEAQLATAKIDYRVDTPTGMGTIATPAIKSKSVWNEQGKFQKIAMLPDGIVTVTLTVANFTVGGVVIITPADGGTIAIPPTPPDLAPETGDPPDPPLVVTPPDPPAMATVVAPGGAIVFIFQPGTEEGLYRVWVDDGWSIYEFRFWNQDPESPNVNPNMVAAYEEVN